MTAAERYAKYRETHTIEATTPPDKAGQGIAGGYHVCAHDGFRVYRVVGGWRHSEEQVREARLATTPAWPKGSAQ